ncbi:protein of unknown function [Aminobacter niigataensis]|nr:protein of unknown function [Aminobacter niigataensis]
MRELQLHRTTAFQSALAGFITPLESKRVKSAAELIDLNLPSMCGAACFLGVAAVNSASNQAPEGLVLPARHGYLVRRSDQAVSKALWESGPR